ncbi:dehydrogenase/reductase SDR family member 13-like, partial [Protobothrops mucrosquamatus]|uniref:dehydrogenase/reductase SDR family member 13-like n=1 Tax=Protobothrops mucrosquamatus TaxID=103944 RepID=UPI0007756B95
GNAGVGKATAVDLARRGARVILACRNKARGESAVWDIRQKSGNSEVILMILDLANLNSVRAFAETFLKSEPRLDILINNAGAVRTEIGYSSRSWLFRMVWFLAVFKRDCDTGAQTSIYCATEEGIESLSGQYFADCQPKMPCPQARDDQLAKKLWEFSERLLGLTT